MTFLRRIMLGGLDINSLPETQKIYYKATDKVTPKKDSLGAVVIANKWDATSGEGVIVCSSDITTIDNDAFMANTKITSVTIPDSVTSIGDHTFDYCTNLTNVTIGNSVTTIGDYAFKSCTSLTSVNIPNSVTTIGMYSFSWCSSLTSITIPNRVTTITEFAFEGCESLTSVNIPDSVTGIGRYAFRNCSKLTSVTIPDSVTGFGYDAFSGCTSLTSVYCKATTPPSLGNINVFNNNASGRKIYVPIESVNSYKSAQYWSNYADAIEGLVPDGVSIQHIGGNFYTTDDWAAKGFSNDDANGVAVKGEQYGFVIAKTWFDGVPWASDASNLVNGILTTTNSDEAKTDFAGAANTELMLATDTNGAAYICSNYTFPNGAKGYLPAAGEADVITKNITTITSAMNLISGNTIPNNPIWSSTQYSSDKAWVAWNRSIAELEKNNVYSCYTIVVTAIKK